MTQEKIANLLLRIGVGFSFLYPSINAIFNPYTWMGYFPKFMYGYVPDLVLLHGFGVVEIIIGCWIISGKKIFLPSFVATFMLIAIVLFNLNNFEVLFRDLAIAAMALSLTIGARTEKK